jgi:hypothetical protein
MSSQAHAFKPPRIRPSRRLPDGPACPRLRQSREASPSPDLLCLGYGYAAQQLARHVTQLGWHVSGTRRAASEPLGAQPIASLQQFGADTRIECEPHFSAFKWNCIFCLRQHRCFARARYERKVSGWHAHCTQPARAYGPGVNTMQQVNCATSFRPEAFQQANMLLVSIPPIVQDGSRRAFDLVRLAQDTGLSTESKTQSVHTAQAPKCACS